MNLLRTFFLCTLLLSSTARYLPCCSNDRNSGISAVGLKKHISVLSDDSLCGRAAGSSGGNKAAEYIAGFLQNIGLSPGFKNLFYQQIPFIGIQPSVRSELTLISGTKNERLLFEKDYLFYSSGKGIYFPGPSEMVFAGYGIVAPEYDYNDYQSIDIEGKIVIFLSGEPFSLNEKYFQGNRNTIHSTPEMKHRIALSRGAKGSVMILNPFAGNSKNWNYYVNQYSFELLSLAYSRNNNLNLLARFEILDKLLAGTQYTAADITQMSQTNSLKSFPLTVKMFFRGSSTDRSFSSANVIALKEGTDPLLKDTYILLSAHYDHLGIGQPLNGDSVYNGVIDNASGTAGLLEIARVFSEISTKRSVIFLFTTAEEKGLLGSGFYTDSPAFPIYKTVANINLDGLAFFDSLKSFAVIGSEYSNLGEMFDSAFALESFIRQPVPEIFDTEESFSNSDQFSFAKAGIPSAIIAEGTHYNNLEEQEGIAKFIYWMEKIYHTPFDDASQEINYNAMRQHAEVILSFAVFLADSDTEPKWYEGTPFINARLNSIAERR